MRQYSFRYPAQNFSAKFGLIHSTTRHFDFRFCVQQHIKRIMDIDHFQEIRWDWNTINTDDVK